MFAAAADAACDFLCSGDQDWMAASVIGPVILAGAPPSAYGRVGGSAPCARPGIPSGHAGPPG